MLCPVCRSGNAVPCTRSASQGMAATTVPRCMDPKEVDLNPTSPVGTPGHWAFDASLSPDPTVSKTVNSRSRLYEAPHTFSPMLTPSILSGISSCLLPSCPRLLSILTGRHCRPPPPMGSHGKFLPSKTHLNVTSWASCPEKEGSHQPRLLLSHFKPPAHPAGRRGLPHPQWGSVPGTAGGKKHLWLRVREAFSKKQLFRWA